MIFSSKIVFQCRFFSSHFILFNLMNNFSAGPVFFSFNFLHQAYFSFWCNFRGQAEKWFTKLFFIKNILDEIRSKKALVKNQFYLFIIEKVSSFFINFVFIEKCGLGKNYSSTFSMKKYAEFHQNKFSSSNIIFILYPVEVQSQEHILLKKIYLTEKNSPLSYRKNLIKYVTIFNRILYLMILK